MRFFLITEKKGDRELEKFDGNRRAVRLLCVIQTKANIGGGEEKTPVTTAGM